jgi:2-dehydro-3-deoxyphosphogluconate aldolase/(4S)-4-hydroxy-2-oxoglutarate aldolase
MEVIMNQILKEISLIGIVPVIALDHADNAVPLAKALCDGGLPCAEITFRTPAAEESIRLITKEFPKMLVGAGTVLTIEQVKRAVKAGARFIVSPGFNPKVVEYCTSNNIPITPGCSSPTDIEQAIEHGIEVVKFFPAEASGGISKIKAMSAPYVNIKFIPTGGINAKNINTYLEFKKIIACGGSWMVNKALQELKDFDAIKALTQEAVHTVLGFELKHIGINAENEAAANIIAESFEKMFGFKKNTGNISIFAAKEIEVMKTPYLGQKGHIAIGTNNVSRAKHYLSRQGVTFNMDTANYDDSNTLKSIYMKEEVGGFALHLVQK